ncbi:hypothetical protein GGI42DRAFT_294127 [Trichoderma sp. SZMC 28013]
MHCATRCLSGDAPLHGPETTDRLDAGCHCCCAKKALHRGRRRRNLPLLTRRKCVVPLGQSCLNHAEFCWAAWLLSAQQTDDVRSRHRFRLHKLANFSPPLQYPALAAWRWPRC